MPDQTSLTPSPLRAAILSGLLAAVALLACVAAPAPAATKSAASPVTGMTATLAGTQLTVTPGQRFSRAFQRSVQGNAVTVACVTGAEEMVRVVDEESLMPESGFDVAFLGGPATWPAGANAFSYALGRDVSASVDGCVVAHEPGAASTFGFNELGRAALAEGVAEQRLLLAHVAARQLARAREDRRFPAPRRLAAAIAASEPQLRIGFSRTIRRAGRNDVVYVIGRSTGTRVLLSHRQDDGQPVLLRGRRSGEPQVSSPGDRSGLPRIPGDEIGGRRPAGR